ncbi:MAG: hypothetical protein GXP24_05215 [Planctomycetes bacterium]|nr:hypothetical protein [Planctomycetota bacterium]
MQLFDHTTLEIQTWKHDDLQKMLKDCPLLIRMNDGREFFIENSEFIVIADYTAAVLVDDDGVKRNAVLTLMNITSVIPNATAAGH